MILIMVEAFEQEWDSEYVPKDIKNSLLDEVKRFLVEARAGNVHWTE